MESACSTIPATEGVPVGVSGPAGARRRLQERFRKTTRAPISETNGQAPKAPLDPGNGNWDPPPVTAPTTQH